MADVRSELVSKMSAPYVYLLGGRRANFQRSQSRFTSITLNKYSTLPHHLQRFENLPLHSFNCGGLTAPQYEPGYIRFHGINVS